MFIQIQGSIMSVPMELWDRLQGKAKQLFDATSGSPDRDFSHAVCVLHDAVFSVENHEVTAEQLRAVYQVTELMLSDAVDARTVNTMLSSVGFETIPSDKTKRIYDAHLERNG